MDEYTGKENTFIKAQYKRLECLTDDIGAKLHKFDNYKPAEYEAIAPKTIDIALQGVGVNGHYGFNEPFSKKNSKAREVSLCESSKINNNIPSTMDIKGKTLGLCIVKQINEHIILASGKHKKDAILSYIELDRFDEMLPVSILKNRENISFYLTMDTLF